ncbi:uncharacterized protein MELLADRAFT_46390 [Melampsora larici-populina 98AG31]|uniref:Uncharacterized protein n=1 Tax=Melampsora larici-populina (strain 98AG31 / pathotype 3-4-7) TaxID=747676 RepID=F4R408_MELLP|nr:uncharacterized protein MELLADRAFT_46390 [Melampsora larici-populina 98AG31]EGG13072.1 hypothetical protein MELLADRAFT_46390 [Melampsora larici-populina 98AG31]
MSTPVDLNDRESLLRAASTSLNSKIVSQSSSILAPIAVEAVKRVADLKNSNVDLKNIRIVKKVGGTIEDTSLVDRLVLRQNAITGQGGPSRKEKAKIGLIQFQLGAPKPGMDNQIKVDDYRQMDKILKASSLKTSPRPAAMCINHWSIFWSFGYLQSIIRFVHRWSL